jgi:hypothetical protein
VLGRSRLELSAALLCTPLTAAFVIWGGRVLSAKRIERQELGPFGILGAVLLALCSVSATVYVPYLSSSYATRYGVIGAVFAMISALFIVRAVLVGAAAAGREIDDELGRIRRGERPADDEVRLQWDAVTTEAPGEEPGAPTTDSLERCISDRLRAPGVRDEPARLVAVARDQTCRRSAET